MVSKLTWVLLYVLYNWQYREPQACERARVTMVTSFCARVEHSVLFEIERSPCWPGNPSEALAGVEWISKLTLSLLYVLYYGQTREHHARERARVTMVTRLCARAQGIVICFRIQETPCLLGGAREPLVVTD